MINSIPKQEIRVALEIILATPGFKRSPLLSRFLRFVVETTLDGYGHHIKEYTVGIEVLNKPQGFNPQTDASVRINAIRLRKMLAEYYQQVNDYTQIRIELPKGSYQPFFSQFAPKTDILSREPKQEETDEEDIVGVIPFTGFIHDSSLDFSISGFCEFLSKKLSLFQDVKVISFHSASRYMQEDGRMEHIGSALGVSYYLSGSIELGKEQLWISFQLMEAKTNSLIWSQQTEISLLSMDIMDAADNISGQIVSSLAGYSGLIHYHKLLDKNKIPTLSHKMENAIFWFYHYEVHHTRQLFYQAIQRLETVVAEDGNCALCWAVLAHLYADALIYNYPTQKNTLETAVAYVTKAFELDPDCQHAHLVQAWIHILLRNREAALVSLEKTNAINPGSSAFKALCSLGMALSGEYARSLEFLKQAKQLNPLPFWWMSLPELFIALKNQEYDKAVFFARKSSTPSGIFEHLFEMIGLYYLDDMAVLKDLVKVYHAKYPEGITFLTTALPGILQDDELAGTVREALQQIGQIESAISTG